jgi:monofunctional biosynthetic peptidoglycan transglycosylase
VLPSPRRYRAANPGPYVQRRAHWIERNVRRIGGTGYLETLD